MMPQADASIPGRVGIVGAAGMLGTELVRRCEQLKLAFTAWPDPAAIDITDRRSVERCVGDDFGLILNASGYTDVDGAETDPDAALAVNHRGAALLSDRCRECGVLLVHFSTDYVFDGDAHTPYRVDAVARPLSVYGRSKLEGERAVQAAGVEHLIIRTSWLFASHGRNFVRTILDLAAREPEIRVVDDQVGRPTWARDLADVTFRLLTSGARGIYHVAGEGQCSWFELAGAVVEAASLDCCVRPCSTAEYPRPARRPAYGVLDLTATIGRIGPMRDWRSAVGQCLTECLAGTPTGDSRKPTP